MSAQVRRRKAVHRYRQIARLVSEADPAAAALRFCIGDIVVPIDPKDHPLRLGPTIVAEQAIVVRRSPFYLAIDVDVGDLGFGSQHGMLQGDPRHYRRVGEAAYGRVLRSPAWDALSSLGEDILLFDVHAARAYGERLLAMADEYEVFADWTRARGRGPEDFINGRWPGPMAREYTRYLRSCDASVATNKVGFANGKIMAKLGRRLLSALEGQPSECQTCEGHGQLDGFVDGEFAYGAPLECQSCQGTGHNLSGTLPPMTLDFTARDPLLRRASA